MSLLFCGITLKHYAYYNMSRRTQLTTKYLFQVLAQLTENFIFIYLGLSLFTETDLVFKPLFILVTVVGICIARWAAVFPLSKAINWAIRYRARRRGKEVADELPFSYQAMLFWAGLRGAVGVALAAGLTGENGYALRATVLVVVVLTVIIFGGTTARMLEILGIRTGVVEEIDSDDEFDIENVGGGTYYKRNGNGIGFNAGVDGMLPLSRVDGVHPGREDEEDEDEGEAGRRGYSSSNARPSTHPNSAVAPRRNSARSPKGVESAQQTLLGPAGTGSAGDEDDVDSDTSDLPPAPARRSARHASPRRRDGGGSPVDGTSSGRPGPASGSTPRPDGQAHRDGDGDGSRNTHHHEGGMTARSAITQLLSGTTEDQAALFRQLDEDFIKPTLLLDQGRGGGRHGGGGGGGGS